jgi:predicted permease
VSKLFAGRSGGRWLSGWRSDVRQTARSLGHSPGHIAIVVVCLGLGLAASIAIFSIVNSLLFGQQAGIRDRQSLVRVYLGHALARGTESISGGQVVSANPLARTDYAILREHGPALTGLAAEGDLNMAAVADAGPVAVVGALVSGNYFQVLGTEPQLGRLLTDDDDRPGAPPVVVVGDYFWRTSLGGRPEAVGRPLPVAGLSTTVVGVAPPRFSGLQPADLDEGPAGGLQLFLPLSLVGSWPGAPPESAAWLSGVGRLARGSTRLDAEAQLNVAARRVEAAYPATRPQARVVTRPHGFGPGDAPSDVIAIILLFLSVPMSVLAIACANVANLQLARATERTRELAVRLSLGATRLQLIRLLTLESLALAVAASAIGATGALVALRLIGDSLPFAIPYDWRVGTFAVGLAAFVTMLTGLAPAWLVLRRAVASGLRHDGRTAGPAHARLRSALVVVQVALSVGLLFIGALFTRSLGALNRGIPPIAREILVTELELRQAGGYTRAEARRFADAITSRLAMNSRISAAGFADFVPSGGGVVFSRPGETGERDSANGGFVTPGWFDTVRARVLAGRLLNAADAGTPVALVNETLATSLARSGAPVVGMTLSALHTTRDGVNERAQPVQIVGVIADPIAYPDGHKEPAMYLPMPADPPTSLVLLTRALEPGAVTADLRATMASIDPRLPFFGAATVASRIARELSPIRYIALSVGAFGALALLLALLGLYAVLAYVVSLRRREIGVRVAIGAGPRDVMGLVVRQSLRLVAIGGLAGFALAVPLAFLIRAALIGISAVDPLALVPTLAALGAVALVAAAVPARRAARIDPVRALRED